MSVVAEFKPVEGLLDNTQTRRRYWTLVDPSASVIEFKCYVRPECSD